MNTQIKTGLIITVILFIGMVLGALISGIVGRYYYRKAAFRIRTHEGFVSRMEMIIQPDESQRKVVRDILMKHYKLLMKPIDELPALMDSLMKDLEPILTEEQKERLKHMPFFERRKHFRRKEHFWDFQDPPIKNRRRVD
jgi:hypothetical protein